MYSCRQAYKMILRISGAPVSRRVERDQVSVGLVNCVRFGGALDEANEMNQQDVVNSLNLHDFGGVGDIDWPFANIAVSSLLQVA